MKLIYKEDPREWRKSALLAALGLAILSSFLCWRRHLPINCWSVLAELILLMVIVAGLRPRWFRGWYRFSLWLGFHSSQFTGRCVLLLFFIFIVSTWMFIAPGRQRFIATQTLARCPNLLAFVQRQRPDGSSFLTT